MSNAAPRAAALADQYIQANADLLALVEAATPAQWRTMCVNEGRTVGVMVHHLAVSAVTITGLVNMVAHERPLPPLTQEIIDHNNARHAETYAEVGPGETLTLLRQNTTAAADSIRALTDAQLNTVVAVPAFSLAAASAGQLIEFLLIGHTLGHLASIETAITL